MQLIPYQRLTIRTELPKDEVVRRLRERVGPTKRNNLSGSDRNIFFGQLSNDKFILSLLKDHRNSWTPEVCGLMIPKKNETEIIVTLRLNTFVVVFTAAFLLIGLYMLLQELWTANSVGDFDWPVLLFIIIPYGLSWFGFNLDADRSIDGLIKITKGEIINAR